MLLVTQWELAGWVIYVRLAKLSCRRVFVSGKAWELSQQAIDAEIKSLEESIRALKHRRNALSPVSSLPPEMIAAIFSFLCLPVTPSLDDCGTRKYHLARLCVSHVCHQWREITLNQPLLWSHVDFNALSLTGAVETLVRAKSAPLYLKARLSRRR